MFIVLFLLFILSLVFILLLSKYKKWESNLMVSRILTLFLGFVVFGIAFLVYMDLELIEKIFLFGLILASYFLLYFLTSLILGFFKKNKTYLPVLVLCELLILLFIFMIISFIGVVSY